MIQFDLSDDTPVYVISVAAQLSGLHAQTLRAYDRLGLVSPGRTSGRGRRYSLRDVVLSRLQEIPEVRATQTVLIFEEATPGQERRDPAAF